MYPTMYVKRLYSDVHAFPREIVDGGQKQQDAAAFELQNASHAAG